MAVDLYSACPCGSGKKFKWCCSSVWGPIEKAYESFSKGQVESAIAQMKTLQSSSSDNPEVFGRLAELLLLSGQPEQAEAELEKLLKLTLITLLAIIYGLGYELMRESGKAL